MTRFMASSASVTRRLVFSLVLALGGAEGCGRNEATLCDMRCDCEGCSDARRQLCEEEYYADGRAAENAGCPDLYDAVVNCRDATAACVGAELKTNCKLENERLESCLKPEKLKH